MRAELKRLHRQFGMTVVYATPDELEALSMGEEIAVLRDGRAVQQGSPDDLYETAGRPLRRRQDRLAAHEHLRREGRQRRREPRDAVRPVKPVAPRRAHAPRASRWRLACGRPTCASRKGAPASSEPTVQQLEPLGDVTVVSLISNSQPLPHGPAGGAGGRTSRKAISFRLSLTRRRSIYSEVMTVRPSAENSGAT